MALDRGGIDGRDGPGRGRSQFEGLDLLADEFVRVRGGRRGAELRGLGEHAHVARYQVLVVEALREAGVQLPGQSDKGGVHVLLGHPRELLACAATGRVRVGDLEEQSVLAARYVLDGARAHIAVWPGIHGGHLHVGRRREDRDADELRRRDGDGTVRAEADARLRADRGALGDGVRRRRVEVLELHGTCGLLLLDALAGGRERVCGLDVHGLDLGGDQAGLDVRFVDLRARRDAQRDRTDGLLARRYDGRRGGQEQVGCDAADDHRERDHGKADDDGAATDAAAPGPGHGLGPRWRRPCALPGDWTRR